MEHWNKQSPQPQPAATPWWSHLAVWIMLGGAVGGGVFTWTQRRDLLALAKNPQTQAVGRDLKQAAQDFAQEYIPAAKKWEGDKTPVQPSADRLSAPVDPARAQGRLAGRKGTTARSLGVRKRVGERDMKSAADAEEYRQDMNMPIIQDDFVAPFWGTDLGRGIKYSACFSIFFGAVGWFLFRNMSRHGRTF